MPNSERPEDNLLSDEPRISPDHPVFIPGTPELRRAYQLFLDRGQTAKSTGKIPSDAELPVTRTSEAQQVIDDLQNNPDVVTKRIKTFLEE